MRINRILSLNVGYRIWGRTLNVGLQCIRRLDCHVDCSLCSSECHLEQWNFLAEGLLMTGLMQILPNNNCSGILTLREIQFWKRHYFQKIFVLPNLHGRWLRGRLGDGPPNVRWGRAHPSIPIFWEVLLLLDAWQSTNWLKKCHGEIFFLKLRCIVKKRVIRVIYQISDISDFLTGKRQTKYGRLLKKGHQNFRVKVEIWFAKFLFRPPKLGAKSPSMLTSMCLCL